MGTNRLSEEEFTEIRGNLRRSRESASGLKIHVANVNKESGVDEKSGFEIIDRKLGVTSMGRKVMRVRGGGSEGENVSDELGHEVLRLRGGVSQGSDCDSDGVPGYMQGEYGDDDRMELLRARREVEDFPVLVPTGDGSLDIGNLSRNRNEDGILSTRSARNGLMIKRGSKRML